MILPFSFFSNLSLTQLLCKVRAPFSWSIPGHRGQAAAPSTAVLLQAALSLLSLLIAAARPLHPLPIITASLLPAVPLGLHYLAG